MFGTQRANRRIARRTSGFTLIELMITITVASVLLAIAVPSFNGMIVSNRVSTQANEFVAAINFARSEAIKRNTSMTMCRAAAPDDTDCEAAAGNWTHWIVRPVAAATVVRRGVVNNFSNAIVVRSNLTNDQVVFGPDGLARTGTAIVNNQRINICSTRSTEPSTRRRVVLGAGSRLFTETFPEAC
jgi:type IV fimbrial biogenesis protein FimT